MSETLTDFDNSPSTGSRVVGKGENVFQTATDVRGQLIHVDDVVQVLDLLESGVPQGSIALIDDSGGTLTAPILSEFIGVICTGGTVRSHLATITREFQLPCLMGVKLDEVLAPGTLVELETTKTATTADTHGNQALLAHVRVVV